jgi:hypothetical protein
MGAERVDYSTDEEYQEARARERLDAQEWAEHALEDEILLGSEHSDEALDELPERPWHAFKDGFYPKAIHDVRLSDGTILSGFWPNAGKLVRGDREFTPQSNIVVRIAKKYPPEMGMSVYQLPYDREELEWWKQCERVCSIEVPIDW